MANLVGFSDPWTGKYEVVGRRGASFGVLRLPLRRELWIAPTRITARVDDFRSIDLIPESHTHPDVGDPWVTSLLPGLPVRLRIHSALLIARPASDASNTQKAKLSDSVAVEVASGLLTKEGNGEAKGLIAYCFVKMLCARLNNLLNPRLENLSRRFEDWQLTELSGSLSEQIEGDGSVATTAARCRLSVCQFSRIFKATYGMPLHRYIVVERMEKAKNRLALSEIPIAQIALECGFADQSSFTRCFTNLSGISPGLWRKQARVNTSIKVHLPVQQSAYQAAELR